MNKFIWTGIVENREDPLRLDRVQVRVFGVHTESLEDIPTEMLPWAISMNMGAAISGLGHSGSQYLNGTMVFVFFQDGESKQQPVILGAMPLVPAAMSPFDDAGGEQIVDAEMSLNKVESVIDVVPTEIIDEVGTPVDTSATTGKPVTPTPEKKPEVAPATTPPPSDGGRDAMKKWLGKRESGNDYKAKEKKNGNFIGKYQQGSDMLYDLGYVKKGTSASGIHDPKNWTGKNGLNSADDYLNNPAAQEKALDEEFAKNEQYMRNSKTITDSTTAQEKTALLAGAHIGGAGGMSKLKKTGTDGKDGNGTSTLSYYNAGYEAATGKPPTVNPSRATPDNPSREASIDPKVGKTKVTKNPITRVDEFGITHTDVTAGAVAPIATADIGFSDPNEEYPRYLDEQDTNRLARNQNIGKTIVPLKEATEDKNVVKANGKGMWDQSPTPYNTKYPFNNVYETESGHVMEFDDTMDNERIHLYHKTGTFTETDRNGTQVRKIIGDAYEIWERNGYVHIKGTVNITVEGNANILVANDCELEIDGNLNANVGKDMNWSIGGNASWKVAGDTSWDITGNRKSKIGGNDNVTVKGNVNNSISGNENNTVNGSVNYGIKGDFNKKISGKDVASVGGDFTVKTGGAEHHKNGGMFAVDASTIMLNSGAAAAKSPKVKAAVKAAPKKLAPPPRTATGAQEFGDLLLNPRGFEEISDFEEEDITSEEAAAIENALIERGLVEEVPEPAVIDEDKTVKTEPPKIKEKPVMCGTFVHGKINVNEFVSTNFRLNHTSKGQIPLEQAGLKDVEIACNIKKLSENVLEPIFKQYPDMFITSGLRPYSTNPDSEHPKGMAADLQFSKHKHSEYIEIAKWISANVPTGQLILEYRRKKGNPTTWIHVSFGGKSTAPFTMLDHKRTGNMGELKAIS